MRDFSRLLKEYRQCRNYQVAVMLRELQPLMPPYSTNLLWSLDLAGESAGIL